MLVFAFSENKQLGYNRGGIVDDDLPRRRGTVAERGDADSEEEGRGPWVSEDALQGGCRSIG